MQYHYSVSAVKFVFRPQTDRVQIHEQRNNRIHSHAMKGRKRLTRVHIFIGQDRNRDEDGERHVLDVIDRLTI